MDVVNERELYLSFADVALFDNGTWRNSVWYNLLGEDFPKIAVSNGQTLLISSTTPTLLPLKSNSTSTTTTLNQSTTNPSLMLLSLESFSVKGLRLLVTVSKPTLSVVQRPRTLPRR